MRQFFSALSFTAVLCFSSMLSAQDTFTDAAEWADAICGTIVTDNLDDLDDTNILGNTFEFSAFNPLQTRPWGELGTTTQGIFALLIKIEGQLTSSQTEQVTITPDPANGNLEGFCLEYTGNPVITFFDGTTVVDTVTPSPVTGPGIDTETFCWLNSGQSNVTSINLSSDAADTVAYTANFDLAFGDGCDPTTETCYSQLEDLFLDLGSIGPTGDDCDDQKIASALWYLDFATQESLWSDDNHVADCSFFYYMAKGTRLLSRVSDNAEVTQVLEDIQAVLSCVADNEIMAATAAGGDSCYLDWAAYYQDCADFYQSIGSYRKAAKYRKWAWLCAYWA